MKVVRSLFRFTPIFAKKSAVLFRPQHNKFVLPALGIATYAMWLGTQKVFNEEMITVETEDNLQEGEVRELQVGPKLEDTVLVIKYEGKVYCTQSKCAHFGFSLAKGLLFGDKIICPLHNAGFSIKTG